MADVPTDGMSYDGKGEMPPNVTPMLKLPSGAPRNYFIMRLHSTQMFSLFATIYIEKTIKIQTYMEYKTN